MDETVKTFTSEEVQAPRWMGRIIIAVILGEAIWNLIVSVMNNLVVPWLGDVMGPSPGLPTSFTQRPYNYPDLFVSVFELCIAGLVAAVLNYFLRRPSRGRIQKVKSSVPATASVEPARMIPRSEMSPPLPPTTSSRPAPSQEISSLDRPRPATPPVAQPLPVAPVVPVVKEEPIVVYKPIVVAPPAPAPPPTPPPVAPAPSRPVAVAPPDPVAAPAPAAVKPPAPPPKPAPAKPKKPKEVYYNIVGEPMPSDDD